MSNCNARKVLWINDASRNSKIVKVLALEPKVSSKSDSCMSKFSVYQLNLNLKLGECGTIPNGLEPIWNLFTLIALMRTIVWVY